jgi:hypothetical protein
MAQITLSFDDSIIVFKLLVEWGWTREYVSECEYYQNVIVRTDWVYKYKKGKLKNMSEEQAFAHEISERLLKLL